MHDKIGTKEGGPTEENEQTIFTLGGKIGVEDLSHCQVMHEVWIAQLNSSSIYMCLLEVGELWTGYCSWTDYVGLTNDTPFCIHN